jgi:hypothetical protein
MKNFGALCRFLQKLTPATTAHQAIANEELFKVKKKLIYC